MRNEARPERTRQMAKARTKLTLTESALKHLITGRMGMNFDRAAAVAAYEEVGGAIMGESGWEAFQCAYMTKVFLAPLQQASR
jgi:hypothetical protein